MIKQWQRQLRSDRAKPADALPVAFGADGQIDRGFSILREERLPHPRGEEIIRRYCEEQLDEYGARQWSAVAAPYDPGGPISWTVTVSAERDE